MGGYGDYQAAQAATNGAVGGPRPSSGGRGPSDVTSRAGAISGGGMDGAFQVPIAINPKRTGQPSYGGDDARFDRGGATHQDALSLLGQLYAIRDPVKVADLQTQLKLAGYGNVDSTGFIDASTISAYQNLLKDTAAYEANSPDGTAPYTPDTLLAAKAAANNALDQRKGSAGRLLPGRTGHVDTLTDSVTLDEQIQQAAHAQLGRRMSTKEVTKFVSIYHHIEQSANAQQNAARDAANPLDSQANGANSTIVGAPSPGAAAGQFINANNAQEAAGQSTVGYFDAIKSLIGAKY